MVSFRFHLVSLTAVFLGLAVGIAMGATVVDRVTVDAVESQLARVERNADTRAAENASLKAETRRWDNWSNEVGETFVRDRLTGVPVVLVAVRGVQVEAVRDLRQTLTAARAAFEGTVWLTPRLALENPADVTRLGELAGAPSTDPQVVRRAAFAALARRWSPGEPVGPSDLLEPLRAAGFVEFERPDGTPGDFGIVPVRGARVVVASSDAATVADEAVAIPFVETLAAGRRVVAVDLSAPPGVDQRGAPFATALRENAAVAGQITTVDNAIGFRGRISTVLALADLGASKHGHYGEGQGAQRSSPALDQ